MTAQPYDAPYALVVVDDDLIRMNAADIFEEAGFRTFEAADVDRAPAVFVENESRIVLLFTDVQCRGNDTASISPRKPHGDGRTCPS